MSQQNKNSSIMFQFEKKSVGFRSQIYFLYKYALICSFLITLCGALVKCRTHQLLVMRMFLSFTCYQTFSQNNSHQPVVKFGTVNYKHGFGFDSGESLY